jgi:hypothetical protein
LHQQIYSPEFVKAFLELFRAPIERAHRNNELLADPFKLRTVSEPVERRTSGQSFVGGGEPFLYARFDVGYGAASCGVHNGGRGIHVDNPPRLISILAFLNTPPLDGQPRSSLVWLETKQARAEERIPSSGRPVDRMLQSNRAFHDVEPIASIAGDGGLFTCYMAVSCSIRSGRKKRRLSS